MASRVLYETVCLIRLMALIPDAIRFTQLVDMTLPSKIFINVYTQSEINFVHQQQLCADGSSSVTDALALMTVCTPRDFTVETCFIGKRLIAAVGFAVK